MDEHQIISLSGQVVFYDAVGKRWNPAGTSSGLSTVRLIHCMGSNTFRIHARKINDVKEVVLDSQITTDMKYNRPNNDFIQWGDSQTFLGINFRRGTADGDQFFKAISDILQILNQGSAQPQQQPPQSISTATLNSQQMQQMQQTSAAIIQRSIQQQMIQQQAPQQPILHQQQAHLLMQQQQAQAMLGQVPPTQILQQQQQQQPNQPLLQQQQLHQHYMQQQQQQQPQAQSHQSQINHYQHPHQPHLLQQQQPQPQQKPAPPPQQQQQIAPVTSAPIPPPPPPPPPATSLHNQPRINGTSNPASMINNEVQHSPLTTNSNSLEANGSSPSQASSLANELAKCQLKKVNVSRSDSEKESECNNNNLGNPKTTRAASLAYVQDNLMNDLSKKLASRRERLDQQGDNQANNSNSSITNGTNNDKSHEGWLADLIRKEIGKEMSKMKAEILEAIRSELKH